MVSVVLNWQLCEILSWAHHCATGLFLLIGMSISGRLSKCPIVFFSHSSSRERPDWYFLISIMTLTTIVERLHSFQSQVFCGSGPNARKIEVTATVVPRKSIHHGMEQEFATFVIWTMVKAVNTYTAETNFWGYEMCTCPRIRFQNGKI